MTRITIAPSACYPTSKKYWKLSFVGDWFPSLNVIRYYIAINMVSVSYILLRWPWLKLPTLSNVYLRDFKKAFDTVDHGILLYKLECYGIRGLANEFVRSYLTNRLQYKVINAVNSDLRTVSCGVPQGSVQCPLFFLLHINDLYRSIGCNNGSLYADDTAITTINHDLSYAQEQAKDLFTKLYHWCIADKLPINSDKTNFLLLHMKNKPVPRNFACITTEAMQIDRVKSVQYLEMLLAENLFWHEHIDQTCASLVKFLRIFHYVKHFVSLRIARQLYFAFFYSEYSIG